MRCACTLLWLGLGCAERALPLPENVPDLAAPDLVTPAGPDLSQPDLAVADLALPAMPDLAMPDLAMPDLAIPEASFSAPRKLPSNIHLDYSKFRPDDIDGDGIDDLVVISPAGAVVVLLGSASDPLGRSVDSPTLPNPAGWAIGDFDGDGHRDVGVAVGAAQVQLLLGRGDGSFSAGVTFPTGDVGGRTQLAAGDFDGDHLTDVLAQVWYQPGPGVAVLLSDGTGLRAPIPTVWGALPGSNFPLVADFDADGRADVLLADWESQMIISVLRGDGSGHFSTPVITLSAGGEPAVADLDGDGLPDLLLARIYGGFTNRPEHGTVGWLRGRGDGSFEAAVDFDVPPNPDHLAVGDYNGDGRLDIAVGQESSDPDPLRVLFGAGGGALLPPRSVPIPVDSIYGLQAGDFDGNGKTDLVFGTFAGDFYLILNR